MMNLLSVSLPLGLLSSGLQAPGDGTDQSFPSLLHTEAKVESATSHHVYIHCVGETRVVSIVGCLEMATKPSQETVTDPQPLQQLRVAVIPVWA